MDKFHHLRHDIRHALHPSALLPHPHPHLLLLLPSRHSQVERPEFVDYFSGNTLLPGSTPAAHCYCGYQFGYFSGQLGDGAAIYLGEVRGGGREGGGGMSSVCEDTRCMNVLDLPCMPVHVAEWCSTAPGCSTVPGWGRGTLNTQGQLCAMAVVPHERATGCVGSSGPRSTHHVVHVYWLQGVPGHVGCAMHSDDLPRDIMQPIHKYTRPSHGDSFCLHSCRYCCSYVAMSCQQLCAHDTPGACCTR